MIWPTSCFAPLRSTQHGSTDSTTISQVHTTRLNQLHDHQSSTHNTAQPTPRPSIRSTQHGSTDSTTVSQAHTTRVNRLHDHQSGTHNTGQLTLRPSVKSTQHGSTDSTTISQVHTTRVNRLHDHQSCTHNTAQPTPRSSVRSTQHGSTNSTTISQAHTTRLNSLVVVCTAEFQPIALILQPYLLEDFQPHHFSHCLVRQLRYFCPCPSASVTSRSSIETDEPIQLVLGLEAPFHLSYTVL